MKSINFETPKVWNQKMKKNLQLLWLGLVCALISACSSPSGSSSADTTFKPDPNYKRETGTSGSIYIAADESFKPVVAAHVENFEGLYKDAEVKVLYLPGEEAISAMLNSDSIRLVIATRMLTRDEEKVLESQTTSAKTSRLATDAIALVVHRDNMDTILTTEEIRGIMTGKITSWKEINPDSPLDEIRVVFDNEQSSTVRYLQDSVLMGEAFTEKVFAAESNPEVLAYVAKTPFAVGVIGVAWISDQDDETAAVFKQNIRVMMLESYKKCSYEGEFFQPYQGFIFERCYPFTRGVYAIVRESSFGLGTGFVAYAASDPGQRIILKSGLVPDRSPTRVTKWPSKKKQQNNN